MARVAFRSVVFGSEATPGCGSATAQHLLCTEKDHTSACQKAWGASRQALLSHPRGAKKEIFGRPDQAAFSILTAQILYSGIFDTGSSAPMVNLFTAAS